MDTDWVDDETMSPEETLERFAALDPKPTAGPHIPAGGYLVTSVGSFVDGTTIGTPRYATFGGSAIQEMPQTAGI